MKICLRRMAVMLIVVLGFGLIFSWPLPRYFSNAIAMSARNVAGETPRAMIPGDHLQFLYHMWLAQDTFTGQTPVFHNLYEFNAGDDAERYSVMTYYLPFSLFFSVGSLAAGQAFGWNFAILFTLWLTGLFAWALARRFTDKEWQAGIAAMLPTAFPYVWMNLLGGSPTGFAMMWVPLLFYGVDRWLSDKSAWGALWIGVVLFFSGWSDTHVFFFSVLIAIPWALFIYFYRHGLALPSLEDWKGWLKSIWPLVVFIALTGLQAWWMHQDLQDTSVASGRSRREVLLYAVPILSLWNAGYGAKIYIGFAGLLLLAVWAGLGIWLVIRDHRSRTGWALVALLAGMAGIFVLACGPLNPFGAKWWASFIKLIPPYGMIRQTDKIFCLMPTLWVVAMVLALKGAATLPGWRRPAAAPPAAASARAIGFWPALLLLLLAAAVLTWNAYIRPVISLLNDGQEAYAAVARAADEADIVPRALILPLWPGDSHLSSVYQYNASLYRIRMMNGYRPTPRRHYIREVFAPFNSITRGWPADAQLDALLERGVRYIILHEDAFPEKVSFFPVGVSLYNLLSHPRLRFLAQDEAVWSFAILDEPRGAETALPEPPVLFPSRTWNWEQSVWPADWFCRSDGHTVGKRYIRAAAPMEEFAESRWIGAAGPLALEWQVRVRGTGVFDLRMSTVDGHEAIDSRGVREADWTWVRIPVPCGWRNTDFKADIRVVEGTLDLDAIILTGAGWQPPTATGERLVLPAVWFFHTGYTLPDFSGVCLRPDYEPEGELVYAANLYLEPGRYRLTMDFEADAPHGTKLGAMFMYNKPAVDDRTGLHIYAGVKAEMEYEHPDSRYFRFAFDYNRAAPVVVRSLTIEKL